LKWSDTFQGRLLYEVRDRVNTTSYETGSCVKNIALNFFRFIPFLDLFLQINSLIHLAVISPALLFFRYFAKKYKQSTVVRLLYEDVLFSRLIIWISKRRP